MFTFLAAINQVKQKPQSWDTAIRTLDISKINPERAKEVARKLLGIFNRLGHIDDTQLPDAELVRFRKERRHLQWHDSPPGPVHASRHYLVPG